MNCPRCHFDNPPQSTECARCHESLGLPDESADHPTLSSPAAGERGPFNTVIAGKFRILEELGRGGMGVVYRAEDRTLGRTVAVKLLHPGRASDAEARERFVSEARTASGLDHPNICTIHEIGEMDEGQIYIAMAFYEGESLRERIDSGSLDATAIVDIGGQIADGLAAAHKKGIVHRDIKPENIMLTDEGLVKIVDFGLAKLEGGVRITTDGAVAGTVAYMSPEQARGMDVDQRSDLWSLGIILYEMVSGQLPFIGADRQATIFAILNEKPRTAEANVATIPKEVERIIDHSLRKAPSKRVTNAHEVAKTLQALKTSVSGEPVSLVGAKILRRSRRRVITIWAVSMLLVLTGILTIWSLMPSGLAFENRDRLLVADVDNRTDDPVFDLALKTAIEADLQQSPFTRVFGVNEVAETLRLMRRDPGTRVDEALGIDICRFSGVRALILPRILSAGEAYELQAIIVDPVKKRHVDRIRIKARGREEVLLEAIDEVAHEVRLRLGESLDSIEIADTPVIKMTTSSWEALQQFSMGMSRVMEGKHAEAAELLQLALKEDVQFVGARAALGLLRIEFLNQREQGVEMLRQALEGAEEQDLPQHLILNLRALNKQHVDRDLAGALEEYRIYRELFPDLQAGFNNSGIILRSLARYDEAAVMFEKAAEVTPHSCLQPLSNLYFLQLFNRRDVEAAVAVSRRLVELGPEVAFCHHALGWSLIASGRFEESLPYLQKAVSLEPDHPFAVPNLAYVLLAMGKAEESLPYLRQVLARVNHDKNPGSIASATIDISLALAAAGHNGQAMALAREGCDQFLERLNHSPLTPVDLAFTAIFELLAGDSDQAEDRIGKIDVEKITDPAAIMILAQYYALAGDDDRAIELLGKAIDQGYHDPHLPLILPKFKPIREDPRFRALFTTDTDDQS